jgi:hypothetical protein
VGLSASGEEEPWRDLRRKRAQCAGAGCIRVHTKGRTVAALGDADEETRLRLPALSPAPRAQTSDANGEERE